MSTRRFRLAARWLVVLSTIATVALVLQSVISSAQSASRQAQSKSNLERIGLAFQGYHEAHERLPGPIRSKQGSPLLSWRVAILPSLGEQPLYDEFRLDEPWDGPHNKPLLGRMPALFALPGPPSAPGMTFYRSFSGPGTLFDPADKGAPNYAAITDGLSQTIAVVEAREAVPWTRPDSEIPFDSRRDPRGQIGGHFPGGAHVLLLEGSVKFAKETISGGQLKALITRDGGDLAIGDDSGGTSAETDFEPNKSLFADIRQADRLFLYEGLPGEGSERDGRRGEGIVMLQGFSFYRPPLEVSGEDREELRAVIGDDGSFRPWGGPKLCGDFHPDYLAEWRVGKASYQFLICLTCHEVKAFGPGRSLRCNIEAYTRLREALTKARKNRAAPIGS